MDFVSVCRRQDMAIQTHVISVEVGLCSLQTPCQAKLLWYRGYGTYNGTTKCYYNSFDLFQVVSDLIGVALIGIMLDKQADNGYPKHKNVASLTKVMELSGDICNLCKKTCKLSTHSLHPYKNT